MHLRSAFFGFVLEEPAGFAKHIAKARLARSGARKLLGARMAGKAAPCICGPRRDISLTSLGDFNLRS